MLITGLVLFISHVFATCVLPVQEHRTDLVRIPDVCLDYLPRKDMSNLIFAIITGLSAGVTVELMHTRGLFAAEIMWLKYAASLCVKSVFLVVTPLRAPAGCITLKDRVSNCFTRTAVSYDQDLMPSGHTVLAFLAIASSGCDPVCRALQIVAFCVLMLCLMVNRVHYAVDILTALFVGFTCNSLVDTVVSTGALDAFDVGCPFLI
jgi:membrane-associated phospholipid phosphatase